MKPIDLYRIEAAFARLDRLAADHPEAFAGRTAEQWARILGAVEAEETPIVIRITREEGATLDDLVERCGMANRAEAAESVLAVALVRMADGADRKT